MEDADGGLSFDFEGGLDPTAISAAPPIVGHTSLASAPVANETLAGTTQVAASQKTLQGGRKGFRQTVCRHWLRGLCMKGDVCGFLHQLDKARMPMCRFFAIFGECRETDCVYKHTNEDVKECNMYKLGFCPNGPDCRYRHQKLPGPFPPLEDSLQIIQQRLPTSNGGYLGRHSMQKHKINQPQEPPPWQQASSSLGQGIATLGENLHEVQQQPLQKQQQQQVATGRNQAESQFRQPVSNGPTSLPNLVSASTPLPQGYTRYFIVKSHNRENLELSVARGLWATHRNNEAKLNEAFDACENVILIFSVNETRHFQGCAKMLSKIGSIVGGGGWKYAHGTSYYGRNFRLKWLKLCELSFYKTRHLHNPLNDNLPVKISRDCQELERTVGEQLTSLLYMERDSDLMDVANEAGLKHVEEVHGTGFDGQDAADAKSVPFEDNDDDQEDDDSDEDESSSQTLSANHGRGRPTGRGSRWGSQGGMGRGGRGTVRQRSMNFHVDMSTVDGFGICFDRFNIGSGNIYGDVLSSGAGRGRAFPRYGQSGQRFSGPDFSNLGSGTAMGFGSMEGPVLPHGIVFPVRQPTSNGILPHSGPRMMGHPAASMMSGAGPANMIGVLRPHFIGGSGAAGRSTRPAGIAFRPPQAGANGRGRRGSTDHQRRRRNERSHVNERLMTSGESKSVVKIQQNNLSNGERFGFDEAVSQNLAQLQKQQDGTLYTNNTPGEIDSESEDEAPRRSRHGEGKKKRRD